MSASSGTFRRAVAGVGLATLWLHAPAQTAAQTAAQTPAQTAAVEADAVHVVPAQVRIGIERVGLPHGEAMGLVGTTYLLDVGHGVWIGPAAYGAISGHRGGLFTIGGELSWRSRVVGPLTGQIGVSVGGGGGGSAPVGSGLMLRPHADLAWDFGSQQLGVSVSKVRFGSGQVDSNQVGLVWSHDTDFRYVAADSDGRGLDAGGRSGVGLDRVEAVGGEYRPRRSSRRVNGGALGARFGYLGIRADRAIGNHTYLGVEANGAASGSVAGYAEYLGVIGAETGLVGDRIAIGARAALGMGGGGGIDTGGGLLGKVAAYGTVRLTRQLGLTVEGGYADAPHGSFKALHASAGLSWLLDDPASPAGSVQIASSQWTVGVERYRAARRAGPTRAVDVVTLQIDRFVAGPLYVTGQAQSALAGGAGGYSVGLFGAGVQLPVVDGVRVGAEVAAGAAGGGGIETMGGGIVQPKAYVAWDATPALALRVGGGAVRAFHGPLASGMVDVALVFRFGVFSHGDR